jgi:predicted RNase H-like nuclease (RuvC/YqgF family)
MGLTGSKPESNDRTNMYSASMGQHRNAVQALQHGRQSLIAYIQQIKESQSDLDRQWQVAREAYVQQTDMLEKELRRAQRDVQNLEATFDGVKYANTARGRSMNT